MKTGSCLCGDVRFELTGELRPVIACHCVQCRKTSGHHVAATSVRRDQITVQGEVTWYQSSDTARRGFCATCGSNLFWDGTGANISVFAGTLDGDTGLDIRGHIYCEYKGDYYDIPTDAPQSAGYDPELTTMIKD
ncbi:GFA family protein [Halocynthiibacter styelae]|uniref:GFA family protein n=1 Tax=Halocynthiibacter styelae TaxID=2761955 RepID=A0A8J7INT9_9RHOB|nr:GFA family protein [Paenihalocynthiibacter styelae]MBI1494266.1 GFA family protein [Paenihalocynthiibacter styelae]